MKGYKAFNKNLKCHDMQYEIGEIYELGTTPICCHRGFHFCKSLADCYNYYMMSEDTRICEVEALGEVVTDDGVKFCTDKIQIIKEIKNPREKSNASKSSSGFCNSGDWNSGDWNSGDRNSGNCNSGDWNSGDRNSGDWNSGNRNSGNCNSGNCNSGNRNSGDWNSGDWNSGNRNSGNWNSGDWNSGDWNSGDRNSGDRNSGNCNSGDWNSGDWNSGNRNSGDRNSGDRNSGDRNSGDRNSGDWNSGDWNSGVFNTNEKPTIKMFDKESNWTYSDWYNSVAHNVMRDCPCTHSDFIFKSNMSKEEKENHPEHKTIGGYIKTIVVHAEEKQSWWDELPDEDKQAVMSLPNFDADKFYQCTEIRINSEVKE